jgi:WD40 repeat protein
LTLSGKTSPVLDLRSLEPAEAAESRFLACSISSDARYLYYKKSPSYDSFVVDLRHRTLVAKLTKASLLRKTHSRSHEEPFRITSCFSPSGTQVAFSIAADKRIGIEQVDSEAKCILWEWKTGDIKTISPGAPVAFTDATHILMRDSAKRPIVRIVDLAGKETWRRSPVASTSFSWPYILIAEGLKAAYIGNHPTGWV